MDPIVDLSVVVPVYNEEGNLPDLLRRLVAVLEANGGAWELVFVDDGSHDGSLELLRKAAEENPRIRVVEFNRNYGQHKAVFAGMLESRGAVVATLDADLQNPPEELPKLLAKIREGYDVVGGLRAKRRDTLFRRLASFMNNRMMSIATGVRMRDYGCMMRAYRRDVVDSIVDCGEIPTYIPALANLYAKRIVEVETAHAERTRGRSKYNLKGLLRLWLDLLTGFSVLPLRLVSFLGLFTAILGLGFSLFLIVRRLVIGPEAEGLFTLFAILFFFVGAQILGVGILGEYIGRVFAEVRRRPRFVVRRVHGRPPPADGAIAPGKEAP